MKKNIYNNKFIRSYALVFCLMILTLCANAQNVSKAEYFFDNDQGYGSNTLFTLTQSADSTWQLPLISTAGLSIGYHTLYLRTKASNSQWSQTTSMLVEIIPALALTRDSIMAGEYFIDADPKFGKGKKISITAPDSSISKKFTIPKSAFTNLSIGYHTLYMRVKDKQDRWSETTSSLIEVIKNEDSTTVVKVEYFFANNDDQGFGICNSKVISIAPPFINDSATFTIPYNQIPFVANDTLFLRVKENNSNRWSQTVYKGGLNIIGVPRIGQNTVDNEVIVYPNPAQSFLNIDLKTMEEPVTFTLTNLMGELIQQQVINSQLTKLNIEQPNGVYFVSLKNSKQTISKKLVVHN